MFSDLAGFEHEIWKFWVVQFRNSLYIACENKTKTIPTDFDTYQMDIGLRNFQQLHQGHPKSPFFHQKLSRSWQNNFRSFPSLLGQEMSPTREALLLTPKFNEQSTKKSTAPSITQNCWSFKKHFGIPVDLFYSFSERTLASEIFSWEIEEKNECSAQENCDNWNHMQTLNNNSFIRTGSRNSLKYFLL